MQGEQKIWETGERKGKKLAARSGNHEPFLKRLLLNLKTNPEFKAKAKRI